MTQKKLNNTLIYVLLHLVAWLGFLMLPFVTGMPFTEEIYIRVFFHTVFLAVFFYLNIFLLVPKLLTRGRFAVYLLVVLAILGLIVAVNMSVHHLFDIDFKNIPGSRHPKSGIRIALRPLFSGIFILAVSTSYRLLYDWSTNERRKKELENEKLVSELSFLKSQVSPHFLFNTLNNIYALSLNNSEHASEAILKLSQLLRYMLYESDVKQVQLSREVEYLNTYIDLQKMRLRDDVKIGFHQQGKFEELFIEPMLLIPFIENAFKHGINYSAPSEIDISVVSENNVLHLRVWNTLHAAEQSAPGESGIGLNNVRRRLNLLYPGRHELKTEAQGDRYIVELNLTLRQ